MGWCHEFGPQIQVGCPHPMVAGSSSCTCAKCGAVCTGRFNGCATVWERGPVANAPRLVEIAVAREPTPVAASRWTDELPPADFSIRATPVAVAFSPPEPEPIPEPIPTPAPASVPIETFAPPPPPPPPRPRLGMAPHVEKLSQLKSRLDGLRSQMSSLDDAVHAEKKGSQTGDTG